MPLYKTITVNSNTKVLIWKIEEPFDQLYENTVLTENCERRVMNMKSEIHRRGFMSIRHLLAMEGYTDFDLYYDENGKPHLKDNKFISITHSFNYAAIIINDGEVVLISKNSAIKLFGSLINLILIKNIKIIPIKDVLFE